MPKKEKTELELAEDIFAERLARILVDQILEEQEKENAISTSTQ